MIISTTNNLLYGGSGKFTVSGTLIDGTIGDTTNPDFSFKPVYGGSSVSITVNADSLQSEYLGVHGIYTPNFATVRVKIYNNTTLVSDSIVSGNSVMAKRTASTAKWVIELSEYSGSVSIGYIAAGFYATVPNFGVRGSQTLPYLANNIKTAFNINQLAQPTNVVYRNDAPRINLSIPDCPVEWAEDYLSEIFAMYNSSGILSIWDFEDGDARYSSAVFDLTSNVKAHNQTRKLFNVTLGYRAAQ